MASDIHCFTSISFGYLDRARVLAETLRRHHPDWTLWMCVSDRAPKGFQFDIAQEQFDHVVRVDDLDLPCMIPWIFQHDVVELCTAVKGAMLCRLLAAGANKVFYLDPDIALFESLDPLVDELDKHSVVLTPHLLMPETNNAAIFDNEISCLKHGIYNLGFLGVSNTLEGRAFGEWWSKRLYDFCYDDIASGLFTDQRWCDLVPALFPGTGIIRDPGYNVANWNILHRRIEITRDGRVLAGGVPLRFFHFTKLTTVGRAALRHNARGQPEVLELIKWYLQRLESHRVAGLSPGYWAFSAYDDGMPIPRSHRAAFRSRPSVAGQFANPFASGLGSYQEWCMTNL
jgi:hypothetical protein